MQNLPNSLDALPVSRAVGILIFLPRSIVFDFSRLNVHGIWTLCEIGKTASPFNCPLRQTRISSCPDTHPNSAGRLRIVVASIGLRVIQDPNRLSIDLPFQILRRPDDRVVMEVRSKV